MSNRRVSYAGSLALVAFVGWPMHAQRGALSTFASVSATPAVEQENRPANIALTALGGLLGGAVGVAGAGLAGGGYTSRGCGNNSDYCLGRALPGAFWGGLVGHTLGIPLGAHAGNRGRGPLLRSLILSGGFFLAEALVVSSLVDHGRTEHESAVIGVVFATPVLQLISSVAVESRRRK